MKLILKEVDPSSNMSIMDFVEHRLNIYFDSDVSKLIEVAIDNIETDNNGYGIDESLETVNKENLSVIIKLLEYGNNVLPAFNIVTKTNRIFMKEFGGKNG